jgi:hypothetical protein
MPASLFPPDSSSTPPHRIRQSSSNLTFRDPRHAEIDNIRGGGRPETLGAGSARSSVHRISQGLAIRGPRWRRACLVSPHRRRSATVDSRTGFRRYRELVPVSARSEHCRHRRLRRNKAARRRRSNRRCCRLSSDTLDNRFCARTAVPRARSSSGPSKQSLAAFPRWRRGS